LAGAVSTVTPTRMELLKLKQRVGLAQKGHDLLREKMDALVIEFFEVLKRIGDARSAALNQLSLAYQALSVCSAVMGTAETRQASREAKHEVEIEISTRNIMGIVVPTLELEVVKRNALSRGYSLHTTSSVLDDASKEFERALGLLVKLAELEESANAIARELEGTKRRVNALEYILIPSLRATIKFIEMRLDEMERENFSRLKRIKAMLEARE
jgi:V/A-type H+-transporting ATPase subunit D